MVFVDQGKTSAVKKAPKGKCHGCGMVNDHFLSDYKVVSEETNKMIIFENSQEWQAKKQGVVVTEVEKEEVESDKTENPPHPTHEALKDMFGFTNLIVHHRDGENVVDSVLFQLGTHRVRSG